MKLVSVFFPLLFSAGCFTAQQSDTGKEIGFADNPVVAHRGAWKAKGLPENSIASLRHAIALKCTGSEFDVQMTADDSLIINHDPTYFGQTIEKTNYSVLETHRLSNGEKLPTLREYLLAGLDKNKQTRLVLEIKPSVISKERGQLIAERVVNLVRELNARPMTVYISFDHDILKKIIALDPSASVQYLNGERSPKQLKADGMAGADYYYSVFHKHPDWIGAARANNILLNAWTVNDAGDMDWLLANKFDFITTNEPELLFERIRQSPAAKGWNLVWSDEFNQNGLPDSAKWSYDTGDHGWGNNEKQLYTRADTANAIIKNGLLNIIAREAPGSGQYTSARLVSKHKGDWLYGRIEVSAKLPPGRGLWPAIWMLPTNPEYGGWPASGEIDIMEHVGYDPDSVFTTVHTKAFNHIINTQKTSGFTVPHPYDQFHQYAIEWDRDKINFLVDDQLQLSFPNSGKGFEEWPFDRPFHLILNLAVGGNWGGKKGIDQTVFPGIMQVDYVRVWQQEGDGTKSK